METSPLSSGSDDGFPRPMIVACGLLGPNTSTRWWLNASDLRERYGLRVLPSTAGEATPEPRHPGRALCERGRETIEAW